MKDESRTQGQLTHDLVELRRRLAELETLEAERKGAEEGWRRDEARLASIFRAAPVGIGLVSDRVLRQVNDRLCEMVGYSREELVDKSARILYPSEEEFERVGREKYAQIRALGTGTAETRWQRKDGATIHVLLSSSAINPSDLSQGVTFTALDITERKRTEEALRKSEVKFRALAELTPSAIFIIQGDRFVYVNSATATITGYSRDELLSMPCWKVIHPDMHQVVKERCLACQRGEQVAPRYEIKLSSKEGHARWGAFASTLFEYEGNPAVLGTVFDITDRKGVEQEKSRLQTQLRQAQKMEAIGTLAGGIAHDFNNTLMSIIGYAELAKLERSKEKQDQFLDRVLLASSRAKNLVNQILTFSRRREEEKQPIQMSSIIKEGLNLIRSIIPSTIQLRQEIQTGPTVVFGDPTQIHQVLMNLCTNATHAMREAGGLLEVTLSHENIEPGRTSPVHGVGAGRYAKLTVTDTGCGIDPAIMDRIFDPFFTTKQHGEGTGLGLSVVYGIVTSHGGVIDISSEPGKGTTAQVYLPLLEASEKVEKEKGVEIRGGSERILFVDDEKIIVELGRRMLDSLGYHVTARASSIEALELFRARHSDFDLVVTDMTMPDMTGADLAKKMLGIRPDLPIILCTGFSETISEEKAKEIGIRGFLMKPLSRTDLATVIRNILDRR